MPYLRTNVRKALRIRKPDHYRDMHTTIRLKSRFRECFRSGQSNRPFRCRRDRLLPALFVDRRPSSLPLSLNEQ